MADDDDEVDGSAEVVFETETLETVLAAKSKSALTSRLMTGTHTATGRSGVIVGRTDAGGGRGTNDAAARCDGALG